MLSTRVVRALLCVVALVAAADANQRAAAQDKSKLSISARKMTEWGDGQTLLLALELRGNGARELTVRSLVAESGKPTIGLEEVFVLEKPSGKATVDISLLTVDGRPFGVKNKRVPLLAIKATGDGAALTATKPKQESISVKELAGKWGRFLLAGDQIPEGEQVILYCEYWAERGSPKESYKASDIVAWTKDAPDRSAFMLVIEWKSVGISK